MNALELAQQLYGIGGYGAAEMLRRQHSDLLTAREAIKVLRECLIDCLDDSRQAVFDHEVNYGEYFRPQRLAAVRKTVADAEKALADTEEFK